MITQRHGRRAVRRRRREGWVGLQRSVCSEQAAERPAPPKAIFAITARLPAGIAARCFAKTWEHVFFFLFSVTHKKTQRSVMTCGHDGLQQRSNAPVCLHSSPPIVRIGKACECRTGW